MKPKHPLLSKTNLFGIGVSLLAIAELVQQHLPALLADIAPKTNAWITLGIGITIVVLRFVTNGPVSWKADDHL